jgi:hypothetical protein
MACYQGLCHTNERNSLLIRFQELDSEDNRTIFPSFPAYWVNKTGSLHSESERKKYLRIFLIVNIISIIQRRRLLGLHGTSLF